MTTAIVNFGMGNLFSVKQACEQAGIDAVVTAERAQVEAAAALIIPGVGAFADAMNNLRTLDLIEPILAAAAAGKPILGICLGLQLLMTSSEEFGSHEGLNLIPGSVVKFPATLKVPQVGWNHITPAAQGQPWNASLLSGVPENSYMYFVHSFYAAPADPAATLTHTRYGPTLYCSGAVRGNVTGLQFHPEKSGPLGAIVYQNFKARITN